MSSEPATKLSHLEDAPDAPPRLELRADGQLWLIAPGPPAPVAPVRCFPWSAPGQNVSLRAIGEDDAERAFVADPDALDDGSRVALEAALAQASFVFEVTAIAGVREEFEIRTWQVDTQQGARRFQTARDAWPQALPGGGLLIRDVAGDLYFIVDPSALDADSRDRLWAFVD